MSPRGNEFSWSFSRHSTFQSCLQRYYFSYYAAWGGWAATAPARSREFYILKRLATRRQWAGQHAHDALAALLQEPATMAAAAEATAQQQIERMRQEFRQSRAKAYRHDPARIPGLFEHEYNLEIPAEEWQAVVARVAQAVQQFAASALGQELQQLPRDSILAVESRAHFLLDGLKVLAVPDLVVRRDGQVTIYDWKTGQGDLTAHRLQLGVYVLLALDRWTSAPEDITAIAYQPILGQREVFTYTADDLENLRDFIRDSADEMLFLVEDPLTNQLRADAELDCTTDDHTCQTCPFLRACPKWAT